ncbi:hypothetical protein BC830DRAFT_1108196 [Chytriomyces sp. MP71]|nr:hypothetical protein BC830DRAFT_1108196 [Chytriomyces sp. MP71]
MRSNVKKVDAKRAFTHMKKVSLTTLPSKLAASDASLQFALSDVSKKLKSRPMKVSSSDIVTMQFHVHGKVQGVFFRKYTAAKANELSLAGHVFNKYNAERSVEGIVTGPLSKVMQL